MILKTKKRFRKNKTKHKKMRGRGVQTQTQTQTQTVKAPMPSTGYVLGETMSSIVHDPLFNFLNDHTHSLEAVILTTGKTLFIHSIRIQPKTQEEPETRRVGTTLVLSDASAMLLCTFKINRNVLVNNDVIYMIDIMYDPTKSYVLDCGLSEAPRVGGGKYDVLVYKYQDPVVRMVCEYMIILHTIFYEDNIYPIESIFDRLQKYKRMQLEKKLSSYTYSHFYAKNSFWIFVRDILMGQTAALHPTTATPRPPKLDQAAYREGTHCIFGQGLTNCCESTFDSFQKTYPSFRVDAIFDTSRYLEMKGNMDYLRYVDMESRFRELFHAPEQFLLPDSDPKLRMFIPICQEVINIIIISSGRAEAKPDGSFQQYPPISVLEVMDTIVPENPHTYTWIIRSERYHISKSPCVHLGLKGPDITDKLESFFCLDDTYENMVILHSIGHCLDRLYCGHAFESPPTMHRQAPDVIFDQIQICFRMFLDSMVEKLKTEPDYPDPNIKKLKMDNITPTILYLLSINDQAGLDAYLLTEGKTRGYIYVNPEDPIDPLYDMTFSFKRSARDPDRLITSDECWHIKKKYGCKEELRKTRRNGFTRFDQLDAEAAAEA